MRDYRKRWQYKGVTSDLNTESVTDIDEYPLSRLNLPIHSFLNTYSVENTLKYLFFNMRCGIYVMIRNKQIAIFCPFVNKNYTNTWGDNLQIEHDEVNVYYAEKSTTFRAEDYIPDKKKWWANGNIICNVEADSGNGCSYWGDQFLFQIKDMLAETCRLRDVPDCEFFINKRDYPQLKYHETDDTTSTRGYPVEPYGFVFDKDDRDPSADVPLTTNAFSSYAPVLSFYTSKRFADIPIPPSEDWEAATGEMFPVTFASSIDENGTINVSNPRELFTKKNLDKFNRPWEEKVNTAFFRGTATGGGVTAETNQRLHLAHLSHVWSAKKEDVPKLDAKITGWNPRDKKIAGKKMTYIRPSNFAFRGGKENFIEIFKQSSYKYLIYAEGHCAACRYGFMMLLGSVILKVDSQCVADQLWYFSILKPWFDHVPVKADLSDLEEKIDWCRNNDDKCKEIAANAKITYEKFVSRDGILDYLSRVFIGIAQRWREPPSWAAIPPEACDPPRNLSVSMNEAIECCNDGLCGYCKEKYERKMKALEVPKIVKSNVDPEQDKKNLRLRMQLKAKNSKGKNAMSDIELKIQKVYESNNDEKDYGDAESVP